MFHAMAGNPIVDWLFMLGLFGIGLAFILGIGLRIMGLCGAVLMLLMWLAVIPPKTNPIIDDHVIYFFLFLIFRELPVGETFGFGKWWQQTALVKKYRWLR